MKIIKWCTLLLALMAVELQAQNLHYSVCVVEAEYTAEEKSKLKDFAQWFSRRAFSAESRAITTHLDGATGSGTVIELADKHYVLTNRHVIGYAHQATITFLLPDTTLRLPHCSIYAVDTEADLVLISLPDGVPCRALPMAAIVPDDGTGVIVAGYPGVHEKHTWEFTRSTVRKGYSHPFHETKPIISHSAVIHPGCSGGPLLLRQISGYQIIGVNTIHLASSDTLGLAIHVSTVQEFLDRISRTKPAEYQPFRTLSLTGESWSELLDRLGHSCQDSLHKMPSEMPLEVIDHTVSIERTPEMKAADEAEAAALALAQAKDPIFAANYGRHIFLHTEYLYGMGVGHQINLVWERNRNLLLYGFYLSVMLDELQKGNEPKHLAPDFGIGLRLGTIVPLQINKKTFAIPRVTVSPNFSPYIIANQFMATHSTMAGSVPFAIGNDFQFVTRRCRLAVGLHYVYDLGIYKPDSGSLMLNGNRRVLKQTDKVCLMGKNSLALSFAFGW